MPTFNPKMVKLSIAGAPVTGWADEDEPFTWDYTADRLVDDVAGTDGEAVFVENNDRRAVLTVRLLDTAAYNDTLAILEAAGGEFVVGAEHTDGTEVGASPAARIAKPPMLAKRRSVGTKEWIIITHETQLKPGKLNSSVAAE